MFIQGPAGRLEARLWLPDGDPQAVAVMCHPHPAHGGNMHSTPCYRTARGMQRAGLAVVRFNFRSVGLSQGEHDGHGAEEGDVTAVIDWLASEFPGTRIWAGGYSFGARTLSSLARHEERLERILLVALPVLVLNCSRIEELTLPTWIVQGSKDEFGNRADLLRLHPKLHESVEVEELAGADHFFCKRTHELEELVAARCGEWLGGPDQ